MNEQAEKNAETPKGEASELSAGLGAWLPIDTAPRDGTPILGWNAEYGQRETSMEKYGKGSPGFAKWERGDGPLNCGWGWHEPHNNWGSSWKPTHWMPLAKAPNVELRGRSDSDGPA